jgi:hypothetical protein
MCSELELAVSHVGIFLAKGNSKSVLNVDGDKEIA